MDRRMAICTATATRYSTRRIANGHHLTDVATKLSPVMVPADTVDSKVRTCVHDATDKLATILMHSIQPYVRCVFLNATNRQQ